MSKDLCYFKRVREGKAIQLWFFKGGATGSFWDVGGFIHQDQWIEFEEMEEITLDEFREIARVNNSLALPSSSVSCGSSRD